VIETARAVNIPTDQQVLHVLTQEFHRRRPGGHPRADRMSASGSRFACTSFTGAVSAAQNVVKCVRRCGLEVATDPAALASSLSVLISTSASWARRRWSNRRRPTDVAIFTGGAIRHTRP